MIEDIRIEDIDTFPGHPFKVTDDDAMEELTESIRAKGQITPCIVRKMKGGRYELISGHRRKHACQRLGMETLRCEVRELSREEATILMVEANFQRDRILPSEKAFAYKMRLEAMKMHISRMRENQKKGRNYGGRPVEPQIDNASQHLANSYGLSEEEVAKIGHVESRRGENYRRRHHIDEDENASLTCDAKDGAPVVPETNRVRDQLAAISPDSREQIRRYIRLTELIPELLQMVDDEKMGLRTAVELSYLGIRQKDVYECMELEQCIPTHAQAIRMRNLHKESRLTTDAIESILTEKKGNQKAQIVLHADRFKDILPKYLNKKEYEDFIAESVGHYTSFLKQQMEEHMQERIRQKSQQE